MINEYTLPIDPTVYATSDHGRGSFVDSGTSLVYLVAKAYDSVVNVPSVLLNMCSKKNYYIFLLI